MTQPQYKIRADFEAWAKDRGYQRDELDRSTIAIVSPEYFNPNTEESWQAWQAACAQQSAQSQQDDLDAPGLLLTVIQRLNGNPYSLTKVECISEVEAMRDAAIAAQSKGEKA